MSTRKTFEHQAALFREIELRGAMAYCKSWQEIFIWLHPERSWRSIPLDVYGVQGYSQARFSAEFRYGQAVGTFCQLATKWAPHTRNSRNNMIRSTTYPILRERKDETSSWSSLYTAIRARLSQPHPSDNSWRWPTPALLQAQNISGYYRLRYPRVQYVSEQRLTQCLVILFSGVINCDELIGCRAVLSFSKIKSSLIRRGRYQVI